MGQDTIYKFLSKKKNIGKWFTSEQISKALKVSDCSTPLKKLVDRGEVQRKTPLEVLGKSAENYFNIYLYSVIK